MEGFREPSTNEKEVEISITQEDFDKQFSTEHQLIIEGNEAVTYTTVVPEVISTPDWVVYVGGFGQGKDSYLDEIKDLAQSGRKVLFTNPVQGIEREGEPTDILSEVPDTIVNKSEAVKKILEELGAECVDVVGHSQGAAVLTAYAVENPGMVKRLVLECPAGLMEGDDSAAAVMGRFAADKVSASVTDAKTILGEAGRRAGQSFAKEAAKETWFRLTQEIPGAAAVDIAPLLKELKKHETEVVLVNASGDKVFPTERIEETLGDNPLREYVDRWAMYDRKNASHSAPVVERAGLLRQILE